MAVMLDFQGFPGILLEDVWRYYCLLRTTRNASRSTMGHESSYLNGAAAFYRHLVGLPMDRDPPASP